MLEQLLNFLQNRGRMMNKIYASYEECFNEISCDMYPEDLYAFKKAWNARQPEIDELKKEMLTIGKESELRGLKISKLMKQVKELQSDNEELRHILRVNK